MSLQQQQQHQLPRFQFKIQKIKDWLEWLTVMKRHTSVCPLVLEKNQIYLTRLDDNFEDGIHIAIHKNMLEEYSCNRWPVVFGMDLQAWMDALRLFKDQHVRLLEVQNCNETHTITITGTNPETQKTIIERIPIVDVDTDIPVAVGPNVTRTYPFFFELQSKPFHKHCKKMAKASPWVRITLDAAKQSLQLEPLSDINTPLSTTEMPVTIVRNPSMETPLTAMVYLHQVLREKFPMFTTKDLEGISGYLLTVAPISMIVSSQKLLTHSYGHKLNCFLRFYMENKQELLLKYILRQSSDDDQESSRVESWIGYRIEKKNDAVLQTESFIQCFDHMTKVEKPQGGKRKLASNDKNKDKAVEIKRKKSSE